MAARRDREAAQEGGRACQGTTRTHGGVRTNETLQGYGARGV